MNQKNDKNQRIFSILLLTGLSLLVSTTFALLIGHGQNWINALQVISILLILSAAIIAVLDDYRRKKAPFRRAQESNPAYTCDICRTAAQGNRYFFWYGKYLGVQNYAYGAPSIRWKINYHILGKSSAFICTRCFRRELWQREFTGWKNGQILLRTMSGILFYLLLSMVQNSAITLSGSRITNLIPVFLGFMMVLSFGSGLYSIFTLREFGSRLAISLKKAEISSDSDIRFFTPAQFNHLD